MTQNYAFDPLRLQSEVSDFARSVGIEPLDEVRFVFDGSGITPAWAGNSYELIERHVYEEDHPRMGGE